MPGRPRGLSKKVTLPNPIFMWHLDQIADMCAIPMKDIYKYIYYDDLTPGPRDWRQIKAINIAPLGQDPEWRVSNGEFIRWLKRVGFILGEHQMY